MAQYKEKPLVLQAVKVSKIITDTIPTSLPAWVVTALSSGDVIKLPDSTIVAKTPQGKRSATTSDMLVKNMTGELSIVSMANFLATHDKIGE
jgi:hypothetical protein